MSPRERIARESERKGLALRMCEALGDTTAVRRLVARCWSVTQRTLRRWARREKDGRRLAERLGRPPEPVPRERRQEVIRALFELGPCAGVAVLRARFRDVPYRTIKKLTRRFARVIQRRRGWYRKRLHWLCEGSVWATDFTQPEASLPDEDNRLLLVRDLASGAQLAAVPCRDETARAVCTVLAMLFVALGPPLLLKHDNGGAFCAELTQKLLQAFDVVALRSPPRTPQYNGSCERAGGTLKQRIAHVAFAEGHPETWSGANVDEALWQANTTARPRGANGPTPAEAFARRRPIGTEERDAFKQTRARAIARACETHETNRGTMPSCAEHAAIVRKATQHALCEHGYLEFRRGRISTPIASWKADNKA